MYFCSKYLYKVKVTKLHSRHFVSVTRFCWLYRQRLPDSRSFDTQMTKMQINASGQVLDAEMQQWIEFVPTPSRIVQISTELAFLCQTESSSTENTRYMWLFPRQRPTMTLYVYSYEMGFDTMDNSRAAVSIGSGTNIFFPWPESKGEASFNCTRHAGCFYQWHRGDFKRGTRTSFVGTGEKGKAEFQHAGKIFVSWNTQETQRGCFRLLLAMQGKANSTSIFTHLE